MGRTLLIPAVPELVRYKRPSPTLSIAPARHSRRAKAILGLSDHPDHADFRAGGDFWNAKLVTADNFAANGYQPLLRVCV